MAEAPKPPFSLPPSGSGIHDPLTREALAWLVHLHSGEETEEDWAAFQDWKGFDEVHHAAAERAEKLWERIGPVLMQDRSRKNRGLPVLVVAFVGLSAVAFAAGLFGPPRSFFADYASARGEVRTVTLRDGSQIDLDTGTSFDVDAGQRQVTLYTGQIFVSAKPDPGHPFTVVAGDGKVQALGTAFAVRRNESGASVIVTEHAVRVFYGEGTGGKTADVSAGQGLSYSQASGLGPARPADVEAATAWRRGELVFNDRPLGEVVSELQRYRWGRIAVFSEDLARLPITGTSDIANVDAFLESLEIALPVRVFRMPGLTAVMRDDSRPMPVPRINSR